MDDFQAAGLKFMRESYEKWREQIECVELMAVTAYEHRQSGNTIDMHRYVRYARETMQQLHVDISELSDERAIYMLTYY